MCTERPVVGRNRPVTGAETTRGRPPVSGGGLAYEPDLSRFAVRGVRVAARAVLLHLKTVRVVTPVLLGDVVPLLALHAGQRDLRADVGGSHVSAPWTDDGRMNAEKSSRSKDRPHNRLLLVAVTGLEP